MTVAYVLSDGTVGTAASGLADVEAKVPMTDNTRMLSASIGKSFVGALSIALAIEGRLSLDEPVSRWIGTFDWFKRLPNHESITSRHLLTHSAGIPDHVHMDTFAEVFSKVRRETGNLFRFPVKILDPDGRLHWHPAVEWTGGGLASTSRDLARWGAALFTGRAMTGDHLTELLSALPVAPDLTDVTYGAGVAVYSSGPFGPVYGHAGWIPGYVSSLRHYSK